MRGAPFPVAGFERSEPGDPRDSFPGLKRVVLGYYRYHAVPGNCEAMRTVREDLIRNWYKVLRRRGQKRRINWQTSSPIVKFWIPPLKARHPHPNERFYAKHPR